jgi:hypothetical protein
MTIMKYLLVTMPVAGVLLGAMLFGLGGCSSQGAGLDKTSVAQDESAGKEKKAIFDRAGGDFDKMTPEDRKKFLSYFKSEDDARKFWTVMQNPPTGDSTPGKDRMGSR